jgi:hypothetical protein
MPTEGKICDVKGNFHDISFTKQGRHFLNKNWKSNYTKLVMMINWVRVVNVATSQHA